MRPALLDVVSHPARRGPGGGSTRQAAHTLIVRRHTMNMTPANEDEDDELLEDEEFDEDAELDDDAEDEDEDDEEEEETWQVFPS
jgi:hypothetical protein